MRSERCYDINRGIANANDGSALANCRMWIESRRQKGKKTTSNNNTNNAHTVHNKVGPGERERETYSSATTYKHSDTAFTPIH